MSYELITTPGGIVSGYVFRVARFFARNSKRGTRNGRSIIPKKQTGYNLQKRLPTYLLYRIWVEQLLTQQPVVADNRLAAR